MTEQATISQVYRVCVDPKNDIWRKYSFWGMAEDVDLTEGVDLQTKIDSLKEGTDTNVAEYNAIKINGDKAHDEFEKKFNRYKDKCAKRMDEMDRLINDNILSQTTGGEGNVTGLTIDGWPWLIDMLNNFQEEVYETTQEMLNDLSRFSVSDIDLEGVLDQTDYEYILARLQELSDDEIEKMDEIKAGIGDISTMNYMLSDDTNTTDTKIAPLIVHHQTAINNLKSLGIAYDWSTIPANVAIAASPNVAGVSGTIRYQKDTGLCMAHVQFTGLSCAAGSEITLGTLEPSYAPLPLNTSDSSVLNTIFVVQVRNITADPEIIGIIDDSGVITLRNKSSSVFTDNIDVSFLYLGKATS